MTASNRAVVIWLVIVCACIFAMVVVGGVTRLTESGLSIVEWQPIVGVLPPLNDADWQAAFDAYKQYPQYLEVNRGMSLDEFKVIFFWEYAHRVLGRFIGVIYFVPLVLLWFMGRIERRWMPRLLTGLALGGAQGLLGWYMVKSGLIDMPRVSHYRLAAHLLLAMFILAYLFWLILDILGVKRVEVTRGRRTLVVSLASLLFLQILYGAFTAGMRAGYGYNTFPLMHDKLMADAVFFMSPLWINFFESGATVQFIHRWLGSLVVLLAAVAWILLRKDRRLKWAAAGTLSALLVQFGIGVLTLIHVVPITLASLHQAWACIVIVVTAWLLYLIMPTKQGTVT